MDINKLFLVSLIVYAIVGSIFFISCEIIVILVYLKTRNIFSYLERIANSIVAISDEIKTRIQIMDMISSIKHFINKHLRKEENEQ